jgi:DNA invertase Pin-like site-specific DNA recombinase
MRLIAYTRVSTDEQAQQGVSLSIQPDQLARHAAAQGHQLVRIIADEGVSGAVPLAKRRGGAELLAALEAGEAEGVLVVRLDRLFRDALDGLSFFAGAAGGNAPQVISASEAIDTSTPQGRLQLTIMLATAQYERDVAAQRAADNARGMRRQGRVYGTVPYGCLEIEATEAGRGRLVRCPKTWKVREAIMEWRADNVSYSTISDRLRAMRVPAPEGGVRWSKSTLRGIVETHAELSHLPLVDAPAKAGEGACLH